MVDQWPMQAKTSAAAAKCYHSILLMRDHSSAVHTPETNELSQTCLAIQESAEQMVCCCSEIWPCWMRPFLQPLLLPGSSHSHSFLSWFGPILGDPFGKG